MLIFRLKAIERYFTVETGNVKVFFKSILKLNFSFITFKVVGENFANFRESTTVLLIIFTTLSPDILSGWHLLIRLSDVN